MASNYREPMFNISERAPIVLAAVLIACHVVATYGPVPLSNQMAYWGLLRPLGTSALESGSPFANLIGHGFLHASWGHVLMNSGMIVVFGVATIRGLRGMARDRGHKKYNTALGFMLIFMFGVIGGGVSEWVWWALSNSNGAALGASGGASALFATTAWAMGGKDKMISFGLGWALINVVFVLGAPIFGVNMAWAAHMGGYAAGAIAAPFMVKPYSTGLSL